MPREAFKCYYNPKTKLYRKRIKGITLYDRDEKELKKKYNQVKKEFEASIQVKENVTVAEYAIRWFKLNTGELSNSRQSDYRTAINKRIAPKIGNMQVKEIKPDDLKEIMSDMKDMSYSSQIKTVTALKKIFQSAEDNKLIMRSPCFSLKAGGYESEEKIPLSDKQADILLESVKGTSVYPFIMLGLYTGMRREEILGLCWDSVYLEDTPYISVRRALTFENSRPKVSEELKTKAAYRNIPIPPMLVDCLKTMEHKSKFVLCNILNQPHSLTSFRNMWDIVSRRVVFVEENLALVNKECKKSKRGPKIKRNIDFAVSPHILRHTYITNLILSGMNIKKVQYLAGHKDLRMTLGIYTKLMENKPKDMIDDIKNVFRVKDGVKNI